MFLQHSLNHRDTYIVFLVSAKYFVQPIKLTKANRDPTCNQGRQGHGGQTLKEDHQWQNSQMSFMAKHVASKHAWLSTCKSPKSAIESTRLCSGQLQHMSGQRMSSSRAFESALAYGPTERTKTSNFPDASAKPCLKPLLLCSLCHRRLLIVIFPEECARLKDELSDIAAGAPWKIEKTRTSSSKCSWQWEVLWSHRSGNQMPQTAQLVVSPGEDPQKLLPLSWWCHRSWLFPPGCPAICPCASAVQQQMLWDNQNTPCWPCREHCIHVHILREYKRQSSSCNKLWCVRQPVAARECADPSIGRKGRLMGRKEELDLIWLRKQIAFHKKKRASGHCD